jgi:hypothetical protein
MDEAKDVVRELRATHDQVIAVSMDMIAWLVTGWSQAGYRPFTQFSYTGNREQSVPPQKVTSSFLY